MDKISVIVPIYNIKDYVVKCVQSIIDSTYKNLEIILVDDGSTDESGTICDRFAQCDNRIIVLHKVNGGLVSARKLGVEQATGKYAAFVDGDDFIEYDLYERAMKTEFWEKADLLCFGYQECGGNGELRQVIQNKVKDGIYDTTQIDTYSNDDILEILHSAWNKIYVTELLKEAVKKVDDSVIKGEDLALSLSYLNLSRSLYIDNSIIGYRYIERSTSITHVYDKYSIEHASSFIINAMALAKNVDEYKAWNKLIYNEIYNIIMGNCIGCTFAHYGRLGIIPILKYFGKMARNEVMCSFFAQGLKNDYFNGGRAKFAKLMLGKRIVSAFILRVRKQVG